VWAEFLKKMKNPRAARKKGKGGRRERERKGKEGKRVLLVRFGLSHWVHY
jgi:hypothetical protein